MHQLQIKYQDLCHELNDCKIKVERIPHLLTEVARLRGSSRASMKALSEQDKQIADLRNAIKLMERDNNRLRTDNRSMQDVEHKLRDANIEIARLMTMASEVSSLKAG